MMYPPRGRSDSGRATGVDDATVVRYGAVQGVAAPEVEVRRGGGALGAAFDAVRLTDCVDPHNRSRAVRN
jgi:hypothetical protein